MATKTCVRFATCNFGTADGHNLRTERYLANTKNLKMNGKLYLNLERTRLNQYEELYDYHPQNVNWRIGNFKKGSRLEAHLERMKEFYKETHKSKRGKNINGREMNLGTKEVTMRGNGKTRQVNVCVPLVEAIVVCDEKTTLEDVKKLAFAIQARYNYQPLHIALHRDEGHTQTVGEDGKEREIFVPNLHAHIVFDRMCYQEKRVKKVKIHQSNKEIKGHDTEKETVIKAGQFYKLSQQDCRDIQTLAAEILHMERGQSDPERKKKHLTREEFIQEINEKKGQISEQETEILRQKEEKKENEDTIFEQEKVKRSNIQTLINLNHQIEQVRSQSEQILNSAREKEREILANAKQMAAAAADEWQRELVKENDDLREENKTLREENSKIKHQGLKPKFTEYVENLERIAGDVAIFKSAGAKAFDMIMQFFDWFKDGVHAILNFTNRAGKWDSFNEKEMAAVKNCLVHQRQDWGQTPEEAKKFLINAAHSKDEKAWNLQVRHEIEAAERDASLEITRSNGFSRGR